MKNQILSFIKSSLLCTILLSTAAMAMDPPQDPNQQRRRALPRIPQTAPNLAEKKVDIPVPPKVTYGDLVYTLALERGEINGWKVLKNEISSWLQQPENRAMLEDRDGVALEDLEFFQVFLHPFIDETTTPPQLVCMYQSDPRNYLDPTAEIPAYLHLYHDASAEQFETVRQLKEETTKDAATRLLSWMQKTIEKKSFTRAVKLKCAFDSNHFTPNILHLEEYDALDLKFPEAHQRRKVGNFMYFSLNYKDSKRNTKEARIPDYIATPSEDVLDAYRTTWEKIDLSYLERFEEELGTFYYKGNEDQIIASNALIFNKCLFDINGTLTITAKGMGFTDPTTENGFSMFHCMGPLTLRPLSDQNCPIKKICIYPADSKYPIFMAGSVLFTEIPEIFLQAFNVDRIHVIKKKEDE